MKLILRHEDGRERVVRADIGPKHLTAAASPALLDDLQFSYEKLLRLPMWSTTEILEKEG